MEIEESLVCTNCGGRSRRRSVRTRRSTVAPRKPTFLEARHTMNPSSYWLDNENFSTPGMTPSLSAFTTTATASSSVSPKGIYSQSKVVKTVAEIFRWSLGGVQGAMMLLLLVCLGLMTGTADAFNVDLETAFVHEGPGEKGSLFGFAVAQHIDQDTNWLLIGAPRKQTSQPGVTKGGAVYRCKTNVTGSCHEIPFDASGNNLKYNQRTHTYDAVEDKSNQWFGSTIKSSGENGVIVACAPRYVYFSAYLDKREPVGRCYLSRTSTTDFEIYSPCAKAPWGFHQFGYCQAGFSAAFSQDGRRLLIGAPGAIYWQGLLYNYKTEGGGEIYSRTSKREPEDDMDYMGYTSDVGDFNGDDIDDYVVGIPRGENLLGKIELYTQNMTLIASIVGEQVGAYFGNSIAVADLNGDRLQDIIVGAPLYADFGASKAYDIGRVYIYYQNSVQHYHTIRQDILEGSTSRSRFGFALSGLNDINYDGYDDLCVGAPYAGEDRKGAIYIYHGSKKGIITEASQVIYAKDLESPLSAFGAAISGGLDQDGNKYPDILVGAYSSDKAVFLRSKAVVRVHTSIKLSPAKIQLEEASCSLANDTRVPCLRIYTCIKYNGVGVPDELFFDLSWTLDKKDMNTSFQEYRVFYMTNPSSNTFSTTIRLKKKKMNCMQHSGFVKSEPDDKLSPIKATLDFKLNEDHISELKKNDLPPVLDAYILKSTSFTAEIMKDCGIDSVCIPDLKVNGMRVSAAHIIGDKTELELLIIVENQGEDAFNTKLWIRLPNGVQYSRISNLRSPHPVSCSVVESDKKLVVCGLGNPMKRDTETQFTLGVTPTNSDDTKDTLEFEIHANSSNSELMGEGKGTYQNNYHNLSIPVTAHADIRLTGSAVPDIISLNTTTQKKGGKGQLVKHLFQLQNVGLSALNKTRLQIHWPSHDSRGRPVFKLEDIEIVGDGTCEVIKPDDLDNLKEGEVQGGNKDYSYFRKKNKDERRSRTIACDVYCTYIQCEIGYMARTGASKDFVITVKSRFNSTSFMKRREATLIYNIKSVAYAKVLSMPYDFKSVDYSKFKAEKLEVTTKVERERVKASAETLELWIILVSIFGGILLLILIIMLFWWCGFFKRKKPEEEGYFVVNGKTDIDNKIFE